jgi:hypothetical protein
MAVGSGLGASLGIKAETTYGTYAAPDHFPRGWMSGNPTFNPTRVQGEALLAGQAMESGDAYIETKRAAAGTVKLIVGTKGMGVVMDQLFGGAVAPVQIGGTIAYSQTRPIVADSLGKSLTIQAGVPQTDGTVKVYTFLGSSIKSAEFTCAAGDLLTCTLDVDARDLTEAQTLAAVSYPTGWVPFNFIQLGVKLGTFNSESAVSGVRGVTIKVERPLNTDLFHANNAGLKSAPITNGPIKCTGSIDVTYDNKVNFIDRFVANTSTSMVIEWVGTVAIAASNYPTFRFQTPQTFFTGDTPNVDGPDVQNVKVPFECKYDQTNAGVTNTYISTDTAN